jgi:hypothetical protein
MLEIFGTYFKFSVEKAKELTTFLTQIMKNNTKFIDCSIDNDDFVNK